MKSTVPATLVLRPSVPNLVISRIPDSPAVRRRQLSDLPAPSEVTRPPPVTTTIGRPALSRMLVMYSPVWSPTPNTAIRFAGWAPREYQDDIRMISQRSAEGGATELPLAAGGYPGAGRCAIIARPLQFPANSYTDLQF